MGKGCLQRSILQSKEHVPALLHTQGIWELRSKHPGQQEMQQSKSVSAEASGWMGERRGAVRYLHCDVAAIGSSQQCHLLMTEGRDGRFFRHDCPRSDYGNLGKVKIKTNHVLKENAIPF